MGCDAGAMMNPLPSRLRRFASDDSGTIAVTRMFMIAAALSIGLIVVGVFAFGAGATPEQGPTPQAAAEAAFRAANFGRDRATVLAEGPRQYLTPREMRSRYLIFSDPRQTSDAELRSAHRTWVRRSNDHAYSQPGRAADMVRLLEQALDARALTPHSGF